MHDTSHGTEGRGYHPCQKSQRDSQGSTTMLQVKQKLQYAVSYSDRPPSRAVGTKLVACCFSLESSFFWVEDELALDVEAVTLASLMLFSWLTSRSTGSIRAQQANCRGPRRFSANLFCALRVSARGSVPSASHYAWQHSWCKLQADASCRKDTKGPKNVGLRSFRCPRLEQLGHGPGASPGHQPSPALISEATASEQIHNRKAAPASTQYVESWKFLASGSRFETIHALA